jgi:hypothetical protein
MLPRPLIRLVCGVAIAFPAAWNVVALVRVFASRLTFPMDLESMEGGCMYQGYRVLHGMYLYGSPAGGFVPYGYPPLHSLLLASLGIVRLDYVTGRGLSISCLAIAALLLAREVLRTARHARWLLALLGLGFIAAGWPIVGTWYDLVRNDEVAIVFPIAAAVVANVDAYPWKRRLAIAALLTAGTFARQTDILFCLPVLGFVLWRRPKEGLWTMLLTAGVALVALGLTELWSHGWLLRTVLGIMGKHRVFPDRMVEAWNVLLMPFVAVGLARNRALSRTSALWSSMLVTSLLASVVPYAKFGGYRNDLIPTVVLAGPTTMLLVADALRISPPRIRGALEWTVLPATALWLWGARFEAEKYMPSPRQLADAKRFQYLLEDLPGGVVSPYHPFLAAVYGRTPEQIVSAGHRDAVDAGWKIDLAAWYARVHPRWVIEDGSRPEVTDDYEFARFIPDPPRMMTDSLWGPTDLLERHDAIGAGSRGGERILFDFEQGYAGWLLTGDAFSQGPMPAQNVSQSVVMRLHGTFAANSFSPRSQDAAQGTLTSPVFTIDHDHMSVLVAGGNRHETRVELLLDAVEVAYRETGGESDQLGEVIWDTSRLRGRQAQIHVVDEDTRSPWGHVVVDRVTAW